MKWCWWVIVFLEEDKDLPVLHTQYKGCWWPGGIKSHAIDLVCSVHEKHWTWSMSRPKCLMRHYDDVMMTMLVSQITSLTVVYSIVYSGVNQRKHQSSASLAFVREIHRGPVNFPHKWPVTRKMFPFDDVIMDLTNLPLYKAHWTNVWWTMKVFQLHWVCIKKIQLCI